MDTTPVVTALVVAALVLAAGAGAAVALARRRRGRRSDALAEVAAAAGLRFSVRDASDLTSLPFTLFAAGRARVARNVCSGTTGDGWDVALFDYECRTEAVDVTGQAHGAHHRFSCATVATGPPTWPHLLVEPAAPPPLRGRRRRGVRFESDEFDRAFTVTCDDARFAHAVLDPPLMALLLDQPRRTRLELAGGHLLVAVRQLPPAGAARLLHHATAVRGALPPVLWDLYPDPAR